jgi:histidyl-tRNA synthetase
MSPDEIWAKDADLAASGEPTSHSHQPEQMDIAEGGAGLGRDDAVRVLDFVEQGRGGHDALTRAEAAVGAQPTAVAGIKNLRNVLDYLDAAGIPESARTVDFGIARGLDYYTGIVYETTIDGWERFGSVSSGGRYDNLASLFTSRRLPGVGASIGLDRLLALMDEAALLKRASATAPVLIANFPGADVSTLFGLAARLRRAGIGAEVFPDAIQIGKQLGYGSTRGHRIGIIVGPDEHSRQVFNLRDLATRKEQKAIPWSDLEIAVRRALDLTAGD